MGVFRLSASLTLSLVIAPRQIFSTLFAIVADKSEVADFLHFVALPSSAGNSGRLEWIPSRKLKFKLTLQSGINGGRGSEKFIFHKGVPASQPGAQLYQLGWRNKWGLHT